MLIKEKIHDMPFLNLNTIFSFKHVIVNSVGCSLASLGSGCSMDNQFNYVKSITVFK